MQLLFQWIHVFWVILQGKIPINTLDVHGLQQKHSFVTSLFLDHTHAKNIEPVSLMIRINFINFSNPSPNHTVDSPFSLPFLFPYVSSKNVGVISLQYPLVDNFLHSFHISSWKCIAIVEKRSYMLITYTWRRKFICESIDWVTRSWNTFPFSALGPINQAPRAAHGFSWLRLRSWCLENMFRWWWLYIGAGLEVRCLFPPPPAARWTFLLRNWSMFGAGE